MENKKEGYTEVVVKHKECNGCKYLDVKDNISYTYGTHTQIYHCNYKEQYKYIGESEDYDFTAYTPDWCPFLNK